MCNADETFWQMCITVIGLKNPPAKVYIGDESVKSAVLRVYCWQVRRKCLHTAVSVFIMSTDRHYGHGVGSGIFSSHEEIHDAWHTYTHLVSIYWYNLLILDNYITDRSVVLHTRIQASYKPDMV